MMVVDIASGERIAVGKPKTLFDAGWELGSSRDPIPKVSYAVMPDGERFLMVRYEPAAIPTRINVVLNWFDELTRRVPVP